MLNCGRDNDLCNQAKFFYFFFPCYITFFPVKYIVVDLNSNCITKRIRFITFPEPCASKNIHTTRRKAF